MARKAMFGEIGEFSDKSMFDTHRYGNLYFGGKDHGIEFFAFVHADAYDSTIFTADVREGQRQAYLDGLLEKATHKRDIGVSIDDRIVLLSTCSSDSTNGRDILVGRITDELYEDQFLNSKANDGMGSLYCLVAEINIWHLLLILPMAMLTARILVIFHKKRKKGV